jgi:hypothetical protein
MDCGRRGAKAKARPGLEAVNFLESRAHVTAARQPRGPDPLFALLHEALSCAQAFGLEIPMTVSSSYSLRWRLTFSARCAGIADAGQARACASIALDHMACRFQAGPRAQMPPVDAI